MPVILSRLRKVCIARAWHHESTLIQCFPFGIWLSNLHV